MKHQICVDANEFAQSIKDASTYVSRESASSGLNQILLSVLPKLKKLSVMACDGYGYYERRVNLVTCKNQPKPTLPGKEMRLAISLPDSAMLVKFISAKLRGNIRLELDDAQITDGKLMVNLALPNGMSTTFFSETQLDIPDFASIKARAEKGRKKPPVLDKAQIPTRELIRAGKAFPGNGSFAQMSTALAIGNGIMALLECKNENTDISVIFMLNKPETI